jgi:hypothetical protein
VTTDLACRQPIQLVDKCALKKMQMALIIVKVKPFAQILDAVVRSNHAMAFNVKGDRDLQHYFSTFN